MSNTIEYHGYLGSVEFSAEDETFYGKILGINDLVTFEGNTVANLKKAFAESVEDYLATCKKLKKTPEKTYKGTFNVRVSSDLHKQAAILATRKNISLNQFIKFALGWVITHEKELDRDLSLYANGDNEIRA